MHATEGEREREREKDKSDGQQKKNQGGPSERTFLSPPHGLPSTAQWASDRVPLGKKLTIFEFFGQDILLLFLQALAEASSLRLIETKRLQAIR